MEVAGGTLYAVRLVIDMNTFLNLAFVTPIAVGDGKGRSMEECYKDSEWCKVVADFLT